MEDAAGLGGLQAAVLDIVWKLGQVTVAEVQAAFPEERRPAYTTVLTVLRSLEKRGMLAHTKKDRMYVYRPAVPAERVRQGALRVLLQRLFGGSRTRLVAELLGGEEVSPDEIAAIKEIIARKEAEDGRE